MYMKDVDSGVCDRHLTMHITAPTLWRTPESHFHQYLSLLIHVNDWLDWTRLYNCLVCSHLLQATWRTQWSACMAYTKQIAGIVGVDKNRIMNETCILRRPGSTQSHRIFIATCTKYWHWKHPLPCKTLAPFTYKMERDFKPEYYKNTAATLPSFKGQVRCPRYLCGTIPVTHCNLLYR